MLRARRREMAEVNDARFLSQGVGRTRMIYEAHRAIRKHEKLLRDIEKTMKERIKGFQRDNTQRYVDSDREIITVQKGIQRGRTSKKRAHCRHHVRLPKLDGSKATEVKEHLITAEQLVKRSATDRWRTPTYTGVQYSTDNDRVGGSNADLMEKVDERHILKVCTLNINGLDDNKLELVLQFFVEEGIDILFLIDARLDVKGGRYTGKKV